ncbi:MAG: molybdopterin-dependent oxidoreductase [Methanobacteriota archaeon]
MKTGLIILLILIGVVAITWIFTLIGFSSQIYEPGSSELSGVEVREYEGESLDSAADFRENSIRGPQKIDINTYRMSVNGLVNQEVNISYLDVIHSFPSYRKVVTIHCVEGWDVTILWEGIMVRDLITKAGLKNEANTVIFHAVDGYTTSFPLKYIMDNPILLAYRMNNETLPEERGYPFELVAENKWGYKWIKWVSGIELTDDPSYEGYWESRGYNNEGDLNRSFF